MHRVRTGEVLPPEEALRTALRDVVARRIYGVDLSQESIELARMSLWLEGMERDKPLSFIDARVKVGNSLLGVTPRLLAEGAPDAAFKPLTGDDKKVARSIARQHPTERELAQHGGLQLKIESPEVTAEDPELGWSGGFSCVIGNPPWEKVKLQEKEFFAARHEGIAKAPNKATRQRLIKALEVEDPALLAEFEAEKRRAEGESHFLRSSRRYPLCGRGDVNTYAVFAETDRALLGPRGRTGVVVPTGSGVLP